MPSQTPAPCTLRCAKPTRQAMKASPARTPGSVRAASFCSAPRRCRPQGPLRLRRTVRTHSAPNVSLTSGLRGSATGLTARPVPLRATARRCAPPARSESNACPRDPNTDRARLPAFNTARRGLVPLRSMLKAGRLALLEKSARHLAAWPEPGPRRPSLLMPSRQEPGHRGPATHADRARRNTSLRSGLS